MTWTSEPIDVVAMRAHIATLEAQLAASDGRNRDLSVHLDKAMRVRDGWYEQVKNLEAQLAAADRLANAASAAVNDVKEWLKVAAYDGYDEIETNAVQDALDLELAAYRAIRGGGNG